MTSIHVDTDNFRIELDASGIAHLVFQPAGGMPVTDARGHAALAAVWRELDARADVRVVLVRSEGKAFCAGGALEMVEDMLQSEALQVAQRLAAGSASALAHTKRSLNLWLHAAWPAFESSLNAEIMGFGEADAREGLAAIKEKRAPQFSGGRQ
jgi:enoyl-CoA hydratase/carnithine racemase